MSEIIILFDVRFGSGAKGWEALDWGIGWQGWFKIGDKFD